VCEIDIKAWIIIQFIEKKTNKLKFKKWYYIYCSKEGIERLNLICDLTKDAI
jgi:hypothetical protein